MRRAGHAGACAADVHQGYLDQRASPRSGVSAPPSASDQGPAHEVSRRYLLSHVQAERPAYFLSQKVELGHDFGGPQALVEVNLVGTL